MKKIFFVRSSDFRPDPRASKYINSLVKNGIDYRILGWNRDGSASDSEKHIMFRKLAKYGDGNKNILNKILWMFFVFYNLTKHKGEIGVVHAVDFDSTLPSYVFCLIFKKELIFDIYDWIGNDSKNDSLVIKLIEKTENYLAKKVDAVIICDENRRHQINQHSLCNIYVLPNIPDFDFSMIESKSIKTDYDRIKIAYVGVFDSSRGIEDLIELTSKREWIELHIAGYGKLESLVKNYSDQLTRMNFYGKVDHNFGLEIIRDCDLLFGSYYTSNPVHRFAAPNKYYESLACGVPIITTKNTIVGEKVEKYNTGYVIDEGYECLDNLLEIIREKKDIEMRSQNCLYTWNELYRDYVKIFMEGQYIPMIKRCLRTE